MTKQEKQKPIEVFLNVRAIQKRRPGISEMGVSFHIAEWHARGTSTVVYKSKQCRDARVAAQLAREWLAKQNARPARIDNVIASMEWTGPRYVDTTREPERFGYSHPAPKTPPGVNPSCDRCGRYNAMLSSYETSVNRIVVRCRDCGYAPDAPRPWSFTQFYLGSVTGSDGPTTIIECEPDDMRVLTFAASYEGTCGIAVDAAAFKRAGSIVVVDGRGNDRARFSRALAYAAQGFARFVHQAASAAPLIEEPATIAQSDRAYGSGPITPANVTDDQIRALLARLEDGPRRPVRSGRSNLISACQLALKSRIYKGSVRLVCDVLNEEQAEPALTVLTLDTSANVKRVTEYRTDAARRAAVEAMSEPVSIASASIPQPHTDALADVAAHVVAARGDVNVALTNASGKIEPRCAFVFKGRRCARVLFHEGEHSFVPARGTSVLSDASILTGGAVRTSAPREAHLDEHDRELPTIDARFNELTESEQAAIVALVNHIASCARTERAVIVTGVNALTFKKGVR